MSISFACPGCRQTLQVSDAAAGRSGKCPHCKGPIVVPSAPAAAPVAAFTAAPVASYGYAVPTAEVAPAGYPGRGGFVARADGLLKKYSPWSYVAAGGGALVVLLLFFVLLLSLFSGSGTGKVARYFPDKTNVVVSVNMDDILASPVYRDLKKDFPEIAQIERQATGGEIGINDIAKVWYALNAEAADREGGIAVVTLKRSVKLLFESKIYRSNFKSGSYTIHQGPDHQACQVDNSTVVIGFGGRMGNSTLLKSVLDRGKAPELPAGIEGMQREADFSRSLAVAASAKDVSRQFKQQGGGALGNPEMIDSVEGLVADISLGSSDVTASGRIFCKDAKSAEEVKKAAEGLIALFKLSAPPDVPKGFLDMLGAMKWSQSGNLVNFQMKVSKDQILQLARSIPRF